ncbi:AAA family ATPase [bacterium]|nr:AAA family ATPase [bacterium]
MNITRILKLPDSQRSIFLWGPRKTGKSFWIKSQVNHSWTINLLESDTFLEFAARPALLRERYAKLEARPEWVVIDEVQKLPLLLDEVHWLIENADARFLLTGSSARKLRRGQANLLGGRAPGNETVLFSRIGVPPVGPGKPLP